MIPRPPGSALLPCTSRFRSVRRRRGGTVRALADHFRLDLRRVLARNDVLGRGRERHYAQEQIGEHTSELQSLAYLVCRLLLEKKKKTNKTLPHTQVLHPTVT